MSKLLDLIIIDYSENVPPGIFEVIDNLVPNLGRFLSGTRESGSGGKRLVDAIPGGENEGREERLAYLVSLILEALNKIHYFLMMKYHICSIKELL